MLLNEEFIFNTEDKKYKLFCVVKNKTMLNIFNSEQLDYAIQTDNDKNLLIYNKYKNKNNLKTSWVIVDKINNNTEFIGAYINNNTTSELNYYEWNWDTMNWDYKFTSDEESAIPKMMLYLSTSHLTFQGEDEKLIYVPIL